MRLIEGLTEPYETSFKHTLDHNGGLRNSPMRRSCASPGIPTNACDDPGNTVGFGSKTFYKQPRESHTWRGGSTESAALFYKQLHCGGANTKTE